MQTIKIKVEGMTCGHCKSSVENALKDIGVSSEANVDQNSVEVTRNEDNVSVDKIKDILIDLGYEVVE